MPSDERTRDALAAVTAARDHYRSALVGTADLLRGMLLAQGGEPDAGLDRAAAELGNFAAGHIDVQRFASLVASDQVMDEAGRGHLERAVETLQALLAAAGDVVFIASGPAGGDLRDAVTRRSAKSDAPSAPHASVELARTGRFKDDEHAGRGSITSPSGPMEPERAGDRTTARGLAARRRLPGRRTYGLPRWCTEDRADHRGQVSPRSTGALPDAGCPRPADRRPHRPGAH